LVSGVIKNDEAQSAGFSVALATPTRGSQK